MNLTRWFAMFVATLAAVPAFGQGPGRPTVPHGAGGFILTNEDRATSVKCLAAQGDAAQAATSNDTFGCWFPETYSSIGEGTWLEMEVKPAFAQVYVSSTYVGTVQQFTRPYRALHIPLGPQLIELRAPGFKTKSFWFMQGPDRLSRLSLSLDPKP